MVIELIRDLDTRRLRRWRLALLLLLLWGLPLHAQTVSSPTHTVQPGESLSEIAVHYGVAQEELMALNSIADPDAIVAGQILVLPATAQTPPPPVEVDPDYAAAPGEPPTTHVVRPGDTLIGIAQRYGLDPDELMALNGIVDPDTIVIGQALRLTPPITTGAAQAAVTVTVGVTVTRSGSPIASLNPTVTVAAGDTLAAIALREGVDETALRRLNRLQTPVSLTVGETLLLPATQRELAAPVPQPTVTGSGEYTVTEGDSLSLIAQVHGLSLAALMEANQIDNPDAIYVGQRLILPPPPSASPEDPVGPPRQIGRPHRGFFYYTVKPGDTLSELARDFESTMLAILEYNDLPNQETVFLGLELRIPYGPPPLPVGGPPTPLSGTRFLVSLSRQECWVFMGERVRYSWTCSTGYGEWITRTGAFAVQSKVENAKSTAYRLDMPYWLGIYDVGTYENGIHGLPVKWDTGEKIWGGLIGQPATFGCAMLTDEDAKTLYDLAYLGMPVYIVP